jgi:gliding motility-associated-like protein
MMVTLLQNCLATLNSSFEIQKRNSKQYSSTFIKQLSALFVFLTFSANAQITNIKFSTEPISYTEISGGTNLVAGGSAVGSASAVTPIGFNFVFQGNTYGNFSVNAAGLLKLGPVAVTTESANNASSTTNTPKLYAWWDATATVAAANGGGVTFALTGTAPNRVLTVQWRVAYTTNATTGFSYQVKLFETSNVIEYMYGSAPASPQSASVGLGNFGANEYQSIYTFNHISSSTLNYNNNTVFPGAGNGIKYIFTPSLASVTPANIDNKPSFWLKADGALNATRTLLNVPASNRTASSEWTSTWSAANSVLTGANAWIPGSTQGGNSTPTGNNQLGALTLDLGSVQTIHGVATLGAGSNTFHTKDYVVRVSNDNVNYTELGLFSGNELNTALRYADFDAPVSCRYVRIIPSGFETLRALRVDVYTKTPASIANNTKVANWEDNSGNQLHAYQNNVAAQPNYSTNQINFNPAVNFTNNPGTSLNIPDLANIRQSYWVAQDVTAAGNTYFHVFFGNETNLYGAATTPNFHGGLAGALQFTATMPAAQGSWRVDGTAGTASSKYDFGPQGKPNLMTSFSLQDNAPFSAQSISFQAGQARSWNGPIAEIITFQNQFSTNQQNIVETYLGIKYGISVGHDYITPNGTIVWNRTANITYHNNVFGIGRSNSQGLHQRQSFSTAYAGKFITLGNNSVIGTTNTSSAGNDLTTDNTYLIVGDNNAALLYDEVLSGDYYPLLRKWKVSNTGVTAATKISVPAFGNTSPNALPSSALQIYESETVYLAVDLDGDGNFSNATYTPMLKVGSGATATWEINQLLPNNAVIGFAVKQNLNDTDGDGVIDVTDIDDDNDGVIDALEQTDCKTAGRDFRYVNMTGTAIANKTENTINTNTTADGATWISSYSTETYSLPLSLKFKREAFTAQAMVGLIPVGNTQTPNAYTDNGYKFYLFGGTVYGYFGTTWNFTHTSQLNEEYSIDIAANGMVTVKINGVQKHSFQGANSAYRFVVSSSSTSVALKDIRLTNATHPERTFCIDRDTDGDGIPNRLELDSDNDGCSDAVEAGTVNNLTVTTVAAPYGTNGLSNSLETVADNGIYNQTINYYNARIAAIKGCADTDGDAVADLVDLDDDNDGITDAQECAPFNINNLNYAPQSFTVTNGASASQTFPAAPDGLVVNVWSLDNSFNVRINGTHLANPQELEFWSVANTNAVLEFLDGTSHASIWNISGNQAKPIIRVYIDKFGVVKVFGSRTTGGPLEEMRLRNGSFNEVTLNTSTPNTFQIGQMVVSQTFITGDYGVVLAPNCDADNDGIPNGFDLDSDGDGCTDAKEAGVTGTLNVGNIVNLATGSTNTTATTANVPNAIANGPYGANGLANGLEATSESGVTSYPSSYTNFALNPLINACIDTDSDGYVDVFDIDDDNDGVLDVVEQADCVFSGKNITTIPFSGTAVTARTAATITSSNTNSWLSSYSNENFTLPLSLKFKRPVSGNTAMFGLVPSTAALTPNSWGDAGYKFYFTAADVNGYFGAAWNFTQTTAPSDEYSIDISATGFITVRINGIQKMAFQGPTGTYKLAVSGLTTMQFTDVRLTNIANPEVMTCPDMDNDGQPNYLDLDSDGDGCSDAIEAGSSTTATSSTNFPTGTDNNANGLLNNYEGTTAGTVNYASTYTNFATTTSINACTDSDGDGIRDILDLDDDNDGVLDVTECPAMAPYSVFTLNRPDIGFLHNVPVLITGRTAQTVALDQRTQGVAPNNFTFNSFSTWKLVATDISPSLQNRITVRIAPTPSTSGTFAVADAMLITNGINTYVIDNTSSVAGEFTTTGTWTSQSVAGSYLNNSNQFFQAPFTSLPSATWTFSTAPVINCPDTDGDGIQNHLDLDADGDGCTDSREAGVTGTLTTGTVINRPAGATTNITTTGVANALAAGPYGLNGFADGLETSLDNGVYNGTYAYNIATNNALNGCLDTDSDGVGDLIDLDDDNDGVLDTDEVLCNVVTTSKTGLVISKPSSINYIFNGSATINNLIDGVDNNNYVLYGPTGTLNGEWFRFQFPTAKILNYLEIGHYQGQTLFSTSTTYRLEGSNNGTTWTDVSGALTYNNSAVSTSGGLSSFNSNVANFNNNTAYTNYRLVGINAVSGGTWATEIYFKEKVCNFDSDNDGIPNTLDLDSDGDGCSDAKEAGSSTTATSTTVFPTGTDTNGNGLLNIYEGTTAGTTNYTSTFVSFGLNANLNVCNDTDNDGVGDILDLDDDNDGVLDVVEFNCSNALMAKTGITVSSTVSWGYNSTTLANMVDGVEAIVAYNTSSFLNQTVLQFNLPSAKILGQIEVGNQAGNNPLGTTGTYKIQAWDGAIWVDLTGNLTFTNSAPVNAANNSYKFNMPSNFTAYTKYRIFGTSNEGTVSGWIQEAYFVEKICNRDLDGDGVQNHLDLDSDNDGCADAIEAGSSSTATSTSVYPTGSDSNTNGLLTIYEGTTAGTINYTNTYLNYALTNLISACLDTDSDGVKDIVDLDDDNDGVLDAVECPLTQLNTNESNGTFGTAAAPRNLANTSVTGGYVYSGSNSGASQYAVVNQSTPYHPAATFWRYVGHTTGTANDAYLAVNGNTTIGNFYSESVTLQAGAKYRISFWHQAASIANDYQLAAEVLSATNAVLASANTGAQNSLGWKYTSIDFTSTSNQTVSFILKNISTNSSGNDFSIDDISIQAIGCPDSDLDGIPNQLDLDSDGDGCSDAKEAGSSTTATSTSVYPTGTDTNGNGLLNIYESTTAGTVNYLATYNFAINTSINGCTDSDSDGVRDVLDLDDDNDGVLDITEQKDCLTDVAQFTFNGTPVTNITSTTLTAVGVGTGWKSSYSTQTLTLPISLSFKVNSLSGLSMFGLISVDKTQTPNDWTDGGYKFYPASSNMNGYFQANWDFTQAFTSSDVMLLEISETGYVTAKINGVVKKQFQGIISDYRLVVSSANLNTVPYTDIVLKDQTSNLKKLVCTDIDTDNDGTPNRLDTDSDGDGCFDAVEAGTTAVSTSGVVAVNKLTTDIIPAPYGANGFADGLELTVAESGTYKDVYTYSNAIAASVKMCTDSDNDGVPNVLDVDDDNDGITDFEEDYPACNSATSFNWVTWSVIQPKLAIGTITVGGQTINVTAKHSVGGMLTTAQVFQGSNFPIQFGVPINANTIANFLAGDFTVTFSQPIGAPTFAMASVGNGVANISVPVITTIPYKTEWAGLSTVYNSPTQFTGTEGYNIVSLKGYGNSFQFNYSVSEGYCNIVFGVKDMTKCSGIPLDTDNDGTPNSLDTDSDNDGCSDANEAYNNTTAQGTDGNAYYGTGNPPTVNANGSVTGATYPGTNAAVTTAGSASTITAHPADQTEATGATATFTVTVTAGSGTTNYQWQVSTNGGSTWTNVSNAGVYTGATTSTLTITGVTSTMNEYRYRVQISQSNFVCGALTSNSARLILANNVTIINDNVSTPEDTPKSGNVLSNDSGSGSPAAALTVTTFTVGGVSYNAGQTATITGVGTIVVNADGLYTFTPVSNYNGTVPAIDYTATDANGGSGTGILNITVTAVNDLPVAVDDIVSATEDTPVSGNVLTNDTDADGNTLTVTQFVINGVTYTAGTTATIPGVGTVVVNADGSFTFTPAANYSGNVPDITYTVSDGNGGTDTGLIDIVVSPTNDAPLASDDTQTTPEDTPVSGNVLTNDTDLEGNTLTVTTYLIGGVTYNAGQTATIAGVGTIVVNADGTYTFTPVANYNGSVPAITYTVSDVNGGTDTGALNITVTAVNDAPIATDNTNTVNEDTPATGNVLTNDTDADGNTLSVTQLSVTVNGTVINFTAGVTTTLPGIGTIVVNADGTYTFTPNANWNGTVPVITYTVSDGNGGTDTGTLAIIVTAVNDSPIAVNDDNQVTPEDTPITGNVLTNDSDPEGNPITVSQFTVFGLSGTFTAGQTATIPGVGTIVINSDGSYVFTPAANYSGSVPVITYTAADSYGGSDTATLGLTVTPVNDAPIATDDVVSATEDTPVSGNVLTNDTDAEGNTLTVTQFTINGVTYSAGTSASISGVGTIVVNADGTFTFTPTLDYSGNVPDIIYTVVDGNGGSDTGLLDITVNAVNDAPLAADDIVVTQEDVPATGTVLTNDTDLEGTALTVTQFTIAGISGTFNAGQTATIPGVGTIVVNADGSFTFTPALNYTGTVPLITYTVSDGNSTDTAVLSLFVDPVNDAPVANNDSNTVNEDTPATGNILTNDTDTDTPLANLEVTQISFTVGGTTYTYPAGSSVSIPAVGTIIVNANGTYTFTPNANWNGTVPIITYTVSDGEGGIDTGTLTITVTAVNDAPIASDDTQTTQEDTPVSGNVITNDTDLEGNTLTVTQFIIAGISGTFTAGQTATISGVGTIVVNADGTYTFTPVANYNGNVPAITYTVSDGNGGTDIGILNVIVTSVNDAPLATDDSVTTQEDTPVSGNVLTNDTDAEGNTLAVSQFEINGVIYPAGSTVAIPGVGSIVVNSNGTFTFTPVANYNGTVPTINYTVTDGQGGSDSGALAITVAALNDAPLAVNDNVTTFEDTPINGNVLANDSDPDGNSLTVTQFTIAGVTGTFTAGTTATIPGVGTVVVNADGTFTFTPVTNYNGTVPAITYTVSDGNGGTDTADLTLIVTAVNDAPTAAPDTATVNEDTPATGNVLTNDTDAEGNTLTVTQISFTVNGTTYTYPAGTTATIPGVGTIVVNSNGTYTFTPNANWNGTVPVITYTVSDGNGGIDTETLSITVAAVNDAPNAVTDNVTTPEDTPVSGNVLTNDTDVEGNTLTVTQFTIAGVSGTFTVGQTATIPGVGTIVVNAHGTFTFTPVANYNGTVPVITYTVSDGNGSTTTAGLAISVAAVNDAPTATDDAVTVLEDVTATGNVLTNDTDPEGNALTVSQFVINGVTYAPGAIVTIPNVGTMIVNADGTYSFTPVANYNGTVPVVTYTTSDGNGGSDTGTLTIAITPVNDAPEVVSETLTTAEDTPLTGNVLTNDTDTEGNALTISQFTINGQNYSAGQTATITGVGTIVVNSDGTFTFTPAVNYNGVVPVIGYTVSDGTNAVNGSLSIVVTAVNDAPIASNETATTPQNIPATGNVLSNDTDAEGNTLTVTQFTIAGVTGTFSAGATASIPGVGTLVVNADGTYTFTPATNYYGPVPVTTYTVSDGNGGTDTGTLSLSVTPVDTDGDGVMDFQELIDGTSPTDPCSFLTASQVLTPNAAWTSSDCDGDGTPNGTDTAPLDPCVHAVGATPITTNAVWAAADCDNDGESNGTENTNGTNPNDPCSYTSVPTASSPAYATWSVLDCDGDGTPNGTDTAPLDPCVHAVGATPVTTNAVWAAADCDGDGTPNGTDSAPNNPCVGGSGTPVTSNTIWANADCDSDGETNGTENTNGTNPTDPCSYTSAPSAANTIWSALDCDNDGVSNGEEVLDGTNPLNPDSDGDGNPDNTDPNPITPTATNDSAAVIIGNSVTVSILANDDFLPNDGNTITQTGGTATGTVSFNPVTGTMTYTPAAGEVGTTVTVIYQVCQGSVCATATVTITVAPADSDGDGVDDAQEAIDGTNPNNPCSFVLASQNSTPTVAWLAADCDGDGTPNGTDTDPLDPCVYTAGATPDTTNTLWQAADCDGDGLTNNTEGLADTDGDGIPDFEEVDSDGDGIPDATEAGSNPNNPVDTDGDGTPDYQDTDSDGDGIPDSVEDAGCTGTAPCTPTDTDGDGTPNYLDADSDGDGIPDAIEKGPNGATPVDTDGDGTPDYLDSDSDGDGIPDSVEDNGCTGTAPCTPTDTDGDGTPNYLDADSDGDGIPDTIEKGTNGSTPVDTDGDGTPDYLDTDSDGDGIPDSVEDAGCTGTAPCTPTDTDGDGVPNYLDVDSDGDGIPDTIEKGPNGATPVDTDGDGIPNYLDADSDGDGIPDSVEDNGCTGTAPCTPTDTDGDGVPNYLDVDSDGDGIPDTIEKGPNGATPVDTDGDGTPDYLDTDSDGDGIPDSVEDAGCTGTAPCTPTDTDGDGTPNYLDADSDGDGIPDTIEKGPNGATPVDTDGDGTPDYLDSDSDGDGVPDSVEDAGCTGTAPCTPTDTDGDGVPNYLDADSDGDGIPDSVEDSGCTGTAPCTPTDTDGDGTPNYLDADSDGDGIPDTIEKGPNGATPVDTDGDGTPDYLDTDSDGDGIPDSVEDAGCTGTAPCTPTDTDGDGTPNYLDADSDGDGIPDTIEKGPNGATPVDTDGDGTPDYLDTDSDGDGIPDSVEDAGCTGTAPCTPTDTDGDGTPNYLDADSDGDGIPDTIEKGPNGATPVDTDGDGTPDYQDLDSDNDGIPDSVEAGANPATPVDTDGDGTPDYQDLDSDNDGIPDSVEAGANPATPVDTDGDGTPDYQDLDSDNDGIPDSVEKGPNGATPVDTDGDGTPDYQDIDSDGDGILDSEEAGVDPTNPVDTDGDGTPDYLDLDSDGDGVSDAQEVLDGTDPTDPCNFIPSSITMPQTEFFLNGDCDGDGQTNGNEQGPNPNQPFDSDGDGIPDYLEENAYSDSDDDLEPYQAVSPNGDNDNDVFVIRNIEKFPNNTVSIYNRWGVAVYEVDGYGQNNQFFRGTSEGRITISQGEQLPVGTYFYVIEYKTAEGVSKNRVGYIYLNR